MFKPLALVAALGLATLPLSAEAAGRIRGPVYDDSNSHWLDYKTDISEAQRELRKDLRRADSLSDRTRAWDEYRRELADARSDFRKEMAERGVYVPPKMRRGRVEVLPE